MLHLPSLSPDATRPCTLPCTLPLPTQPLPTAKVRDPGTSPSRTDARSRAHDDESGSASTADEFALSCTFSRALPVAAAVGGTLVT
eukprot:2301003-Pleurochrysis_carterae.AAC.1